MRRLAPFLAILAACSPVPPVPDAAPDGGAEAATDAPSAPDAQPAADASVDASSLDARADVLELDAAADAGVPDARDTGPDAAPEAGADASAAPDIRIEHPAMELRVLMRRTCAAGMTDGCDEIQTQAFEASCSVRGTSFRLYFLPCERGLRQCGEVFTNYDGALRAVNASSTIGAVPALGTNVTVTPGLEWVDRMGQRRQNFYVEAQLDADSARARGIAGVAGRTRSAMFADFYALGCPKGP